MSQVWKSVLLVLASPLGCSDAESSPVPSDQGTSSMAGATSAARDPENDIGSEGEQTEALPLGPSDPAGAANTDPPSGPASDAASERFVMFVDAESGFRTNEVHDADREVVFFDSAIESMVWAASGDAVAGWTTSGVELSWGRSGAFRVRFGTENGERRAYFTEADRATICDLSITAPEALSIRATNETPPAE